MDAVTGTAFAESQRIRPFRGEECWLSLVDLKSVMSRHNGHATTASNKMTSATKPTPSTAPSTSMPGLGSATRAAPSGIIGDAENAEDNGDQPTHDGHDGHL